MKMEHIAINVPAPIKAAQWYVDQLGMRIVRSSEKSPFIHFIVDSEGTSLIEFYCKPVAPVPNYAAMHPNVLHLAFTAGEIEADRTRLIAAGATPLGEITLSPSGDRLAFLRDPWGVALQLVQRGKPLIA
jgi:glyoxylase I family protein